MRDACPTPSQVQIARSALADADMAVAEAVSGLSLHGVAFVLAFIPESLDPQGACAALTEHMAGIAVFGCTTAGQITTEGYETTALLLLAFPSDSFRCSAILLAPLNPLSTTRIAAQAQEHVEDFKATAGWQRLGLIFTDGVSNQEDLLVSSLETVLGDLPVFGGSAGDGLRFDRTFVLHEGQAHGDAAVLLLIETRLRFLGLGFDHFLPTGARIVVTEADPDKRLVFEINGSPAAPEYARLVGCRVEELSPQVFAENPLLVQHHNRHYVRAICDAVEGDALAFLAAIDDGLIMTLGVGQEIIETLQTGLSVRDRDGNPPDFILGFDCVLRKLEIEQKQLDRDVSDLFRAHRVLGFNTYGEQHRGVHMNQTFVGVAFFGPDTSGPARP